MKRRVTVASKHVMVELRLLDGGQWMASAEQDGEVMQVHAATANRAASEWAIAAARSRTLTAERVAKN